jgi:hypothetical protein
VNAIASGAPVSSLDRKITRAIIKQRKETETAYKAALTKARAVRSTNLTPLMSAYNMILSIGAETQLAISGDGDVEGVAHCGGRREFSLPDGRVLGGLAEEGAGVEVGAV